VGSPPIAFGVCGKRSARFARVAPKRGAAFFVGEAHVTTGIRCTVIAGHADFGLISHTERPPTVIGLSYHRPPPAEVLCAVLTSQFGYQCGGALRSTDALLLWQWWR
jgi:hypothetical protein